MDKVVEEIRQTIRDVPDFPKPGIIFKDITPLLCHGVLFGKAIDVLAARYEGQKIDAVVGIESRGFIFGAALAYRLGAGFCMVRKPGKLPYETHRASYELEYGSDTLEVHRDALQRGQSAVLVDDLIATGGTAAAATALIEKLGGRVVESAFIIELAFLKARDKLAPHKVFSLIRYDSE